jgi:hypothetical protein
MKKKMKRYEEGGEVEFETKQGPNKSIGDDVRARAMASINKETAEDNDPYGATKKSAPKAASKATPKADSKPYSPKFQPESDREENSAWMRQFRKDEAEAKAKAATKTESKPTSVAKTGEEKSGFQQKMAKVLGRKAGGKVSSASSRADGCAVRGKTRA